MRLERGEKRRAGGRSAERHKATVKRGARKRERERKRGKERERERTREKEKGREREREGSLPWASRTSATSLPPLSVEE